MEIIANAPRGSFVTQERYLDLRLSFFQPVILLILTISSLAELLFFEVPCEEMPKRVSLLSADVGYRLPSPNLRTKLSSLTIGYLSIIGPGGSSRARLIFAMLASPTIFIPSFKEPTTFTKKISKLFKEMVEKLSIEFVPCLDFEMINKLENCGLVSDDFCEEIHQKELVKIAFAGRRKKNHFPQK